MEDAAEPCGVPEVNACPDQGTLLVHSCRCNDLLDNPSHKCGVLGHESRNVVIETRSISNSLSISINAWSTCIMPGHSHNAELGPYRAPGRRRRPALRAALEDVEKVLNGR
jgi:hypothetical protein